MSYSKQYQQYAAVRAKDCFVNQIDELRRCLSGGTPQPFVQDKIKKLKVIDQYIKALEFDTDCMEDNTIIIEDLNKFCNECD